MIAADYYFFALQFFDFVYVDKRVFKGHRPRQIAGKQHDIVVRYLILPVFDYLFKVVFPHCTENIHRLIRRKR